MKEEKKTLFDREWFIVFVIISSMLSIIFITQIKRRVISVKCDRLIELEVFKVDRESVL